MKMRHYYSDWIEVTIDEEEYDSESYVFDRYMFFSIHAEIIHCKSLLKKMVINMLQCYIYFDDDIPMNTHECYINNQEMVCTFNKTEMDYDFDKVVDVLYNKYSSYFKKHIDFEDYESFYDIIDEHTFYNSECEFYKITLFD